MPLVQSKILSEFTIAPLFTRRRNFSAHGKRVLVTALKEGIVIFSSLDLIFLSPFAICFNAEYSPIFIHI